MPVVYYFQPVLVRLVFLVFFEKSSEFPTVFLLIGEEFDAEVLCDIIYPIAQADNLIVLRNCGIFGFKGIVGFGTAPQIRPDIQARHRFGS